MRTVLREIGAGHVPELLVFTKTDTVDAETVDAAARRRTRVRSRSRRAPATGVDELPAVIGDRLRALEQVVELRVPYDRGDVLAGLHRDGEVLVEVHEEGGTRVRAAPQRARSRPR